MPELGIFVGVFILVGAAVYLLRREHPPADEPPTLDTRNHLDD